MSGKTAVFTTESAPPAGPYSQAIKANGLIFVSGQIPADSQGNLIDGNIEQCTEQCLKNINAILKAAGSSLSKVLKTTVYLEDMDDFTRVNEAYADFFAKAEGPKPARACVAVKTLPKNVSVEIDCIALE